MTRRSTIGLALLLAVLSATDAIAQDVVASDGSLTHRTKLERACGESLARFCPDLSATPGQTRNQVICLKPYRTSLPQYCRAAVTAAMK